MGIWLGIRHGSRSRLTLLAAAAIGLMGATSVAAAPAALAVPATATCPQVEVITARGQGEQAGTNGSVLGPLATALQNQLTQTVKIYPLPYDAGQDVVASTNRGIPLLINHLTSMRSSCPNTRFVALGFSLGALVVGEAFAPPATRYAGISTMPLPTTVDVRIAAVVVFGDVRFTNTMSQSYGSFNRSITGNLPRTATAFARFGDHVRDVCNQNDGVCQAIPSWQANPFAHQDYVKYSGDLVGYVDSQLATMP